MNMICPLSMSSRHGASLSCTYWCGIGGHPRVCLSVLLPAFTEICYVTTQYEFFCHVLTNSHLPHVHMQFQFMWRDTASVSLNIIWILHYSCWLVCVCVTLMCMSQSVCVVGHLCCYQWTEHLATLLRFCTCKMVLSVFLQPWYFNCCLRTGYVYFKQMNWSSDILKRPWALYLLNLNSMFYPVVAWNKYNWSKEMWKLLWCWNCRVSVSILCAVETNCSYWCVCFYCEL